MPLRLNNHNETPPGQFQALVSETLTRIGPFVTYTDWMKALKAHHKVNNLPVGSQFEENYEDQLCKNLPPGHCNRDGRDVGGYAGRVGFGVVKQGTETLIEWFFKAGRKKVSKEVADTRAVTCSSCPFNVQVDCASCAAAAINGLVNVITGASGTAHDSHLNSCSKCGCSLKAKVWFPLEVITNHTPDDQRESLPDYCWIKTEGAHAVTS